MWEPRDPRDPRSIAASRLRHVDMQHSRLAHWPPPQRGVEVKPQVMKPDDALEVVAKRPIRRGWHLKRPLF